MADDPQLSLYKNRTKISADVPKYDGGQTHHVLPVALVYTKDGAIGTAVGRLITLADQFGKQGIGNFQLNNPNSNTILYGAGIHLNGAPLVG